ncbi:porin [Methylobacterium sp. BTF04]|uniref:outer membrane beta-barrel protein n=1 Tax=Methylobacterium sp. BTF04 TaxID=2708300 RepID=UPI0013D2A694|nr:outer membrane beta-barrel protein [Methylobacterium sp. BTF04]NEU12379.1 porin [Methylobacterium sp. BTF04]
MTIRLTSLAAAATIATLATSQAFAADMPSKLVAPVPVPEACKAAISFPAMGGVIKQNPNPACLTLGAFGDIYVGGAVTGYAYSQTNQFSGAFAPPGIPADRAGRVDFSNLMGTIQKADGAFQFYAAFGAYTIPGLGLPVYSSFDQTDLLYSPIPIVFGKYVFNDNWSIQGGRMPTLIGSEAPFTFQNLNISRGLLFNQENVINQGVQVNWADGPWAASFAATDGFYSGEINWVTGAITYKIDAANTIGINGGTHFTSYTNFDSTTSRGLRFQFATPAALQNSSIVSANYTYADGPWIVTPYIQYTNVESNAVLGLAGAETFGGALLASYSFTDNFALAGRFEYISQSGNRGNPFGQTSLLYGAGSSALSFTVTPTFTFDRYFLRGEFSTVQLYDITPGLGFGRTGLKTSQERYMVETGITF